MRRHGEMMLRTGNAWAVYRPREEKTVTVGLTLYLVC